MKDEKRSPANLRYNDGEQKNDFKVTPVSLHPTFYQTQAISPFPINYQHQNDQQSNILLYNSHFSGLDVSDAVLIKLRTP
jgi:hypothetical protein